jgi:hypothetical protein
VAHMGRKELHSEFFLGKPEGNITLWEDKIKTGSKLVGWEGLDHGLILCCSRQGQVVKSCDHGNELLVPIKC